MNEKIPCIYIMASQRNGTLYTGVTSDLKRRVEEHKRNKQDGFTKKYNIHTLVYYEVCEKMLSAIEREKQIKAGSRKNKLDLIEKNNPEWKDLTDQI
jgi:putative endonuclease